MILMQKKAWTRKEHHGDNASLTSTISYKGYDFRAFKHNPSTPNPKLTPVIPPKPVL